MSRRTLPLAAGAAALLALGGCGTASVSGSSAGSSSSAASGTSPASSSPTSTMPTSSSAPGAGAHALDGRAFIGRTEIGGDLAPGASVRLRFDHGVLSVDAGCNRMSGAYTLTKGVLSVASLSSTEVACPPGMPAQDAWVRHLLTTRSPTTLKGSTLTIGSGGSSMTLRQQSGGQLQGTMWRVTGTSTGGVTKSMPAGVGAVVTFAADGRTGSVYDGCNSGTFTISARTSTGAGRGTIVVHPGITTTMACLAGRASVQKAVGTVLKGSVSYAISGDSLTLAHAGEGLTLLLGVPPAASPSTSAAPGRAVS